VLVADRHELTPSPLDLEAAPPPAYLEIGGRRHELAVATSIEFGERDWSIGPVEPGSQPEASISYVGGVSWLSCGPRYSRVRLNGRVLLDGARHALFDADVLSIGRGSDVIVRCSALEHTS
jgi:hypothetical protein